MQDLLTPLMFACLIAFLLLGYPVAFALSAVGLLFSFVAIHLDLMPAALLQALPQQVFDIMRNDTLLAIPFFTFMGLILERSGIAEDMLDTIGQLFGRIRGGLAYAVIFVGALLGATTGVVAASVISMGLISLPIMMRYGYDKRLASGVIAASGTLAQIIPPSLVLIVLADQLGTSVGDMYKGALVPSLILTSLYAVYVLVMTIVKPSCAPALPESARTLRGAALYRRASIVMLPPLLLIFLVLGTIFLGIATPTEGGAMGATGAMALAMMKRKLNFSLLQQACNSTLKLTTFVVFILIGARVFRIAFLGIGGDEWVEHLFDNMPGGVMGFLIVVNILIFVLAFFLDFFEIAFILVPILAPIASLLGIDLVWFGVMLAINMQTAFLHPPFGFALFYLKSVAPKEISTKDIYMGAIPFVCIQLLMVAVVMTTPSLVTSFLDKPIVSTESVDETLSNITSNNASAPAQQDLNTTSSSDLLGDTAAPK